MAAYNLVTVRAPSSGVIVVTVEKGLDGPRFTRTYEHHSENLWDYSDSGDAGANAHCDIHWKRVAL